MSNDLRAEVMAAIKAECAAIGFEKRANIFFTKRLSPDTIGVLAFVVRKVGDMLVNPSVAVRYQPLERLLAELTGEKFHPYLSGTLACHLGDVPPLNELLWFYFLPKIDPRVRVREMAALIKSTAVPWMERHRNLESFIEDLKTYRFANRDSVRLRLPLAYYLNNEFDLARDLVGKGLEEIGEEEGSMSTQYRNFSEALLARLPDRGI